MQLQPTNNNLPNGCVMTLKDVVDIINNERGVKKGDRGFLQHGRSMDKIISLSETPRFGTVTKIVTVYNDNDQTIETLALTKKQAIASAAKLDNSKLMFVIDKLEELEKKVNAPTLPQTYADALRALAQEVEEKEREKIAKQKALAKIEQDKPKVEFATAIESSTNAITIGAYAKLLSKEHSISVGPNRLFEFLRNDGVLLKSKEKKNLPSARYMDNGYFEVSAKTTNGVEILTTLITGKGQIKLLDKIAKHFGKQNHQPTLFG